jgi:transcription initiation factor TFIID subunit 12
MDVADDFVESITSFACELAQHRHSGTVEASDVQLHLERNWGILVPGHSISEVQQSQRKGNIASVKHLARKEAVEKFSGK